MAEIIKQFLIALPLFLIAECAFRKPQLSYEEVFETSLTSIAKRDLSVLGHYDMYLYHSIRTRCVNIWKRLLTHTELTPTQISNLLLEWLQESTYDPEQKIKEAVYSVNSEFLHMTDEMLAGIKVVRYSEDLPDVSKVLKYNDYLDVKALDEMYYNSIR